ncbi:MAG: carbonic anhydrase [Parachlamydiaceae bacterium]|nr:carbonic anhydrase [Parachlamydiaceae bacterium]
MRQSFVTFAYLMGFIFFTHSDAFAVNSNVNSEWQLLEKGNHQFVQDPKFQKERPVLVKGQNPNTVILCCSDSRVPPELIFNQGLGEIFVSRVAGQVVDDVVVDSIEYAVATFDVSLVLVLGHSSCGAVDGALKRLRKNRGVVDSPGKGHLNAVLIPIETAIVRSGINIYAKDSLKQATKANVRYMADQLISRSSMIREGVKNGRVKVIGAKYSLKTGKVKQLFVIE